VPEGLPLEAAGRRDLPPPPPPLPPEHYARTLSHFETATLDSARKFPEVRHMPTSPLYTDGIAKLDYEFNLGGRTWHIINWLAALPSPPLSSSELTALATAAQTAFGGLQAFTTTDTTFVGTTATDWASDTGLSESVSAGGTGTESPPTLPIQCAAEISWKIGRKYRGGHPKTFLSGIAEARQVSNRLWTSGFQTGLEAAALAYRTAINDITVRGAPIFLSNFSRFTGGAERSVGVFDEIVGATVNEFISSQRRRRGRI